MIAATDVPVTPEPSEPIAAVPVVDVSEPTLLDLLGAIANFTGFLVAVVALIVAIAAFRHDTKRARREDELEERGVQAAASKARGEFLDEFDSYVADLREANGAGNDRSKAWADTMMRYERRARTHGEDALALWDRWIRLGSHIGEASELAARRETQILNHVWQLDPAAVSSIKTPVTDEMPGRQNE